MSSGKKNTRIAWLEWRLDNLECVNSEISKESDANLLQLNNLRTAYFRLLDLYTESK